MSNSRRLLATHFGDVDIGLFEEFSDQQDDRRGAIARDVILRRRSASNQRGGGVLNLLNTTGRFDRHVESGYKPFRAAACCHPW